MKTPKFLPPRLNSPSLWRGLGGGFLCIALLFASCHRRNEAKERVQAERDAWEASLPDSLARVEHQMDSVRAEISTLSADMEHMLPEFDYVNNPREVEGYYIAKAWKAGYPLKSTGLVARLTQGENLELIAALSGGGVFNQIRVEAGGKSAETSVVPHDQALNYRMAGLNTVCFSDSAANSVAALIASSASPSGGRGANIIFLNDGKQIGSFSYPAKSQSAMTATWNLYSTRSRIRHDERLIPLLARKASILTDRISQPR